MKDKKGELYFVAVLPEKEVREKVQRIKEEVAEKYGSKASLKSPPHFTLYMPFRWQKEREDKLYEVLEKVAFSHSAFELHLKDFGAFKPRVIFIDLLTSDELEELQKDIISAFKRELKLMDIGFEERPFHPHMTIAFRDLKKPMFFKAWNEEFKERIFQESIIINRLTLLKHNGKSWDIYKEFALKT